ncbi:ATP-binding protein [Thermoanaerobacterium sp. DL9XJH110]|uniref:ATP-binding protein n=1 Tax=Thermoanaerobacterium sp. DL9XJH110 TaxID=3386643 RepID=UPI003BB668A3
MKFFNFSLKLKIPIFIVILVIITVSVTGALSLFIATKNTQKEVLDKNLLISRMISERIYQFLSDATETVVTAANISSQSNDNFEQIENEIFRIYDNFAYFDLIFYMNSEARMLFSKPSNEHVKDRTYFDRDYFNEVMKTGKPFVSRLLISSVLGRPHFIIAAPVFDKYGRVQGLIGAGIPLEKIGSIVEEIQREFNGRIWVTDREGVIAVHPDKKLILKLMPSPEVMINLESSSKKLADIIKDKSEGIRYYKEGKDTVFAAISFVPKVDWMVMVEQYEKDVFAQTLNLKRQLKSSIYVIIFIAIISGVLLAMSITNPIERLVTSVRNIEKGMSNIESIPVNRKDEIGDLSRAFNDMSIRLKSYVNELQNSYLKVNNIQQYLNNIIESAASGIIVIDKEKNITVFNKEAEKITGFKSSDFTNKHIFKFCEATKFDIGLIDSLNQNMDDVETNLITKNNDEIPINVSLSPVINEQGEILGTIILFKDLSRIKMLEEELKREDRIRTLGEMSASIIHEIGNPLAGIANLLQVLNENWQDDETRTEIMNILQEEVGNLNKMVINFLNFSRSSKLNPEATNIIDLLEDILNLLKSDLIAKKIIVSRKIDPFIPPVFVDRGTIKQCFLNILINAIQAVGQNGRIVIECKAVGESGNNNSKKFAQIKISDNGIGIPPENIEKIFSPFFTTKKGGTGLGLAITYKLVKENGGKIAVKSEVGKGTEIEVLLPAVPCSVSEAGEKR